MLDGCVTRWWHHQLTGVLITVNQQPVLPNEHVCPDQQSVPMAMREVSEKYHSSQQSAWIQDLLLTLTRVLGCGSSSAQAGSAVIPRSFTMKNQPGLDHFENAPTTSDSLFKWPSKSKEYKSIPSQCINAFTPYSLRLFTNEIQLYYRVQGLHKTLRQSSSVPHTPEVLSQSNWSQEVALFGCHNDKKKTCNNVCYQLIRLHIILRR